MNRFDKLVKEIEKKDAQDCRDVVDALVKLCHDKTAVKEKIYRAYARRFQGFPLRSIARAINNNYPGLFGNFHTVKSKLGRLLGRTTQNYGRDVMPKSRIKLGD